jgi:hypothetical protein
MNYCERASHRPSKLEILDMAIDRWDPFRSYPRRREATKLERSRALHRARGRYRRYRDTHVMRQLDWRRSRYGIDRLLSTRGTPGVWMRRLVQQTSKKVNP